MENYHLRRYSHLSSLRRTEMYASFLEISKALHLAVFHQPPEILVKCRPQPTRVGFYLCYDKPRGILAEMHNPTGS
jgi:hypothetical protein